MNMRIGRFRVDGKPRLGIFEGKEIVDVSSTVNSFSSLIERSANGTLPSLEGESFDQEEITFLPPITSGNQVFACALNYKSHIEEAKQAVPERPFIFFKSNRSLVGHRNPIEYRVSVTSKLDYEAELGVVIGRRVRDVDVSDALDYVAGYTIVNDTTARDIQWLNAGETKHVDWFSAKALQNSTPVGPYVVTADAVSDPQDLQIQSWLNGERMQDANTELMVYGVAELVSYLSTRLSLQPGDIIATGTPEGVGAYQDIQLEEGDTVEITVDGVGTLRNTVDAIK